MGEWVCVSVWYVWVCGIHSTALIARYLGLGMRYEAGICAIVISMNGAFQ